MTYLPDEILCMVCTELWHQRDFNTLFNCACSGKQLATIAMMNLYRMQGVALATGSDSDEDTDDEDTDSGSDEEIAASAKQRRIEHAHAKELSWERTFMKCTGLWRTIILSSLGKTLYPYSQYIQTLDLRELEKLLILSDMRATAIKDFFQDELAQFKVDTSQSIQDGAINPYCQLEKIDAVESINTIGEAITKQTPLLEVLTGKVLRGALFRWIPRLPRLTYLEPEHGTVFEDIGNRIRLHCPSFKGLHLQQWESLGSELASQGLAPFLNEIRPQSLESFEAITFQNLEPGIFQALSCHGDSLTKLKLGMFPSRTTSPKLSLLRGCTNLISLSLTGSEMCNDDLEMWCRGGFCETFIWLKECKKLQILSSYRFLRPAWIAPVFLESSIHLTSLRFDILDLVETENFLQALANQTSLQRLWLTGFADEHEVEVQVESLSTLVNLTDLHLKGISTCFVDRHIVQLAGSLSKLEVWSTDAGRLTDAIWEEVASLRSLRGLTLKALTTFTTNGILNFIEKLGPGNKGLVVSVESEQVNSRAEQALIQEMISKKVEGKFGFTLNTTHSFRRNHDWLQSRETSVTSTSPESDMLSSESESEISSSEAESN